MERVDDGYPSSDGTTDVANDPSVDLESLDAETTDSRRDRDGVASMRDVEAEAGDDEGVDDNYDIDVKEARELGTNLDDQDEQEPRLN
jgi:hypothetical protein